MERIRPYERGTAWIDDLADEHCLENDWLYLENPGEFFAKHPKPLLGRALRCALREVFSEQADAATAA